jgi:hypothetical protein
VGGVGPDGERERRRFRDAGDAVSPPYVEDGQMYVPFDFFRDAFGYSVSIAGDTVNITNPNAA